MRREIACPIKGCVGVIIDKSLGYCLKHCISFGMICEGCMMEKTICDMCERCDKNRCVAKMYGPRDCGDARFANSKYCRHHAEEKGEICVCHGKQLINDTCIYVLKTVGVLCTTDGCVSYVFTSNRYITAPFCFVCLKRNHRICAADRCCQQTSDSLHYCLKHFERNREEGLICIISECQSARFCEELCCRLHCRQSGLLCMKEKCGNKPYRCRRYCLRHAKRYGLMCAMNDCTTINFTISGEDILNLGVVAKELKRMICDKHVCNICAGRSVSLNNLCAKHVCRIAKCDDPILSERVKYCVKHKCAVDDCDNKICGVMPDKYSPYCINHTCNTGGDPCLSITKVPGGYCVKHGCEFKGCIKDKKCKTHKCTRDYCEKTVIANGYETCSAHSCVVPMCKNGVIEKTGDDIFISVCIDHVKCTTCLWQTKRLPITQKWPLYYRTMLPVHNLIVCKKHVDCHECVKDANKTKGSYGFFCKASCHNKLYKRFADLHINPTSDSPIISQDKYTICIDHLRLRYCTYIMSFKEAHNMYVPKEIYRLIWDILAALANGE